MPGGKGVAGVTHMVCPRHSTGWGSSSVDVVNTKPCQIFWPMGSLWWVQSLALGMKGGGGMESTCVCPACDGVFF